jgi:ATP-dependent Clp protease ATP-binding subunit ClpC
VSGGVETVGREGEGRIESLLASRVVGQAQAVITISRSLRRARTGFKRGERPFGSYIFAGPTGVGKTELAKTVAECFYGSFDACVVLDMSEYMEKHSLSRLIGSPPGYVGYGEGGVLTDSVRSRPFCVVLLDEVEKAHPDVFNILLQIMDEGKLTESSGEVVSFSRTFVILTTNIGSKAVRSAYNNSRIGNTVSGITTETGNEKRVVAREIARFFRPELLNRLDEVVLFKPLSRSSIMYIATRLIVSFVDVARSRGIQICVCRSVLARILFSGYKKHFGARPLRRAVEKLLVDQLAEKVLSGVVVSGSTIVFGCDTFGRVLMCAC